MRRFLISMLAALLIAQPALAAEAAGTPEPTPEPTAAPTAEAALTPVSAIEQEIHDSAQSLTPVAEAELPADAKSLSPTADVDTPTAEPEGPKAAPKVLDAPVSPKFHWSRFALGALGGAALGAGLGAFGASKPDGSYDPDKGPLYMTLGALGGALVAGSLSVLLGMTTPEPPRPPALKTLAPRDGPSLAWSLDF